MIEKFFTPASEAKAAPSQPEMLSPETTTLASPQYPEAATSHLTDKGAPSPVLLKKKRVKGTASQRLAKAASRVLRDNSDKIVQTLYERTLAGDVRSGRLLLTFMKRLRAPQPRRKAPVCPCKTKDAASRNSSPNSDPRSATPSPVSPVASNMAEKPNRSREIGPSECQ